MKNFIGAVLSEDLHAEWSARSPGFPGGKSGLIKDALRYYFENVPRPSQPHEENTS